MRPGRSFNLTSQMTEQEVVSHFDSKLGHLRTEDRLLLKAILHVAECEATSCVTARSRVNNWFAGHPIAFVALVKALSSASDQIDAPIFLVDHLATAMPVQ